MNNNNVKITEVKYIKNLKFSDDIDRVKSENYKPYEKPVIKVCSQIHLFIKAYEAF